MAVDNNGLQSQNIIIKDRKSTEISGVREVISFDSDSIVLDTVLGILSIEGKDICVTRLDTEGGSVIFDGEISALVYRTEVGSNTGFFKRLFS